MLLTAAPTLGECTVYRSDSESMGLEQLFDLMAATHIGSPNNDPNVNNAGMTEEGPDSVRLLDLWEARRSNMTFPVVRFVRDAIPTGVELPEGWLVTAIGNWPCLLAPGDQVYLSDGFTDHSTMVYRIDQVAQEVAFIDPRADEVFLLSEKQVLEDFGGRWWMEGDGKLFAVPFSTLDRTLKLAQFSANRSMDATLGAVAALAPDVPAIRLRYWNDAAVLSTLDPATVDARAFDYIMNLPAGSTDLVLANYLEVLVELDRKMHGSGEAFAPGFDQAVADFPLGLSKNMNFRVAIDLILAKEPGGARALIERYIEERGWDLDFALLGAAACRDLGDARCASEYEAAARVELDARLARMFRGGSVEENKAMLAGSGYGSTTQMLARERYDWLD